MATNDNNRQFDDFKNNLQQSAKLQAELNSGVDKYFEALKNIGEVQQSIEHSKEQIKKLDQELTEFKSRELEIEKELKSKITPSKKQALKEELALLRQKSRLQRGIVDALEDEVTELERQNDIYVEQVRNVNKLALGLNSIKKGAAKLPGIIKNGFGNLKAMGIFEMDKEIRLAGKSLNVTGKNFKKFENNILGAANTTNQWGVNAKDLAKAQQAYSEEIGRSVILGEEALIAVGEIAKGTGLGTDGAAAMVAEMDRFGVSVEGSRDLVEETVKTAAKMGVNSAKAIKSLQNGLKLAQKFTFKGGVKGLTTMANEAARLKLDMDGIAGLAEKVFRPEGAVEMAAQLQVMGGEFAKLGDPMQLMFKARNDFAGFAKDIGKATAEFVDFNGEIKGGLAADRMREIAKITGISVEKLQEMGQAQARLNEFGGKISTDITDEDDRALIASLAEMKDGKVTVRLGTADPLNIKDLTKTQLQDFKNQKVTLAQRAKDAETFDEVLNNFVNEFKSSMVPIAKELKDGLGKTLINLMKEWEANDLYGKLRNFAEVGGKIASGLGEAVVGLGKPIVNFIAEWPKISAGLLLLFGPAKWFANGMMMRRGFNAAGGFGGGAGGSGGGLGSRAFGTTPGAGIGKNFMSAAKSPLAKIGGIATALLAGMDEWSTNAEGGMDTGENLFRSGAKGVGSGLGAWGGAAAGAAIGSVVPVIGTLIGGLIGGALGAWGGGALGGGLGDAVYGDKQNRAAPNNALKLNDGIINFNPNDKFMTLGSSAMIAGTNVNGNKELAKAMTNDNGGGEVKHKFDDLNINISLNSDTSWLNRIGEDIANDRQFIRELTIKIQEEIRMAIGGGKLNPNPL